MQYVLKLEIPAGYSFRKEDNKDLVLIGEKKEYEPLSREVFIKKDE